MSIPTQITQGDTHSWAATAEQNQLYPASEFWVLRYTIASAHKVISITSDVISDGHFFRILSSDTQAAAVGEYQYQLQAYKSGSQTTFEQGSLTIVPSFFGKAPSDTRSQAQRSLDNINAVLENRATSATLEYQIAGRMLKYVPISDLIKLQSKFRLDVAREKQTAAIASGQPFAPRGRVVIGLI